MSRFAAPAARFACALAFHIAFAGIASADQSGFWLYDRSATAPLERGQFYAAFTFNAGVQHYPRFDGSVTPSDAGFRSFGATGFSQNPLGIQPGGEIGFVLRDGTLPAFLGSRVRVGLFGSIAHAEQSFSSQRSPSTATFNAVDGRFLASLVMAPQTSLVETLKVEREGFQIGLKAESDVALTSNLSISPLVAVFGGRTRESFFYTAAVANFIRGVADLDPAAINERLRTTEFGGHLGARITWQFQPGLALHVGGTAGPVWLQSNMSATDCFFPGPVRTGTGCTTSAVTRITSVTDSRATIGFRGTATLGLVADLRIATVSLAGFGRYDSRIPGIQNPQQGATVALAGLPAARIRLKDGFAYGGAVSIRVALGN